jgi:hypothetical protein
MRGMSQSTLVDLSVTVFLLCREQSFNDKITGIRALELEKLKIYGEISFLHFAAMTLYCSASVLFCAV